jgi:hypothetical protein
VVRPAGHQQLDHGLTLVQHLRPAQQRSTHQHPSTGLQWKPYTGYHGLTMAQHLHCGIARRHAPATISMIAVKNLHSLNHGLTLVQHLQPAHKHKTPQQQRSPVNT